jgi:hypothetical protein
MASAQYTEDFSEKAMNKMLASRSAFKEYVMENSQQGDIQNVIDTIDKFGWTKQWLMNIGDRKGKILDQAIQERKPKTILELGRVFIKKSKSIALLFPLRYFSRL